MTELPRGWVWTNVSSVANLVRGVSYRKEESSKEPKGGYIPILRANNIDGELNFSKLVYVPRKRVSDEQIIKAFDILIAMSSGSKELVGKASQANRNFDGGFGAFCGLVRVTQEIDRKYAGFFFQSPNYRSAISRLSSGVNINNLRRDHIESMPIPLPPLSEQHSIVAKIEELFTKLDAGVEALNKIKAQLKRYRQAVLKHAFEGKLTEEWRQAHKHELEPASSLLERIKQKRLKTAKGKYKDLSPLDITGLPELPKDWVWVTLKEIGANDKNAIVDGPFGSNLKVSDYIEDDTGVPVLTTKNLEYGYNKKQLRYISHEKFEQLRRSEVRSGDILVAKIGSCGKTGVYPDNMPSAMIPANLLKMTVNSWIERMYVYYFLNSPILKGELEEITTATAQPAFNVSKFRSLGFPLCPYAEQHRIAEEIERRFSIADEIEKTVDHSLQQAERLRQSILNKAFEGKLVPQDPNDEPAEKLLERIKGQKVKQMAEKRVTVSKVKRREGTEGS